MTCPVCGGAGIVDTSPPGVEHTAPWLLTDTDCPRCDGTGEIPEETP